MDDPERERHKVQSGEMCISTAIEKMCTAFATLQI